MAKSSKQKPIATINTKNSEDCKTTTNDIVKIKRKRKTIPRESPQQRSSSYRGVTKHRLTGRYEAHLWDKNCWNESQGKKGRQVYLGAYNDEQAAAHAYDLAALKFWGHEAVLNFDIDSYAVERKEMEGQKKEEYIGSLRRKSSGFSWGVSKYRGVARHHHNGRWEARIGRVFGNKYLYLGTYATQEEAAAAYDKAAVEYRGLNAITNFDLSHYIKSLRPEETSTTDDSSIIQNSETETGLKSVDIKNDWLSTNDETKVPLLDLTSDAKTSSALKPSNVKEMSEQTAQCNSSSSTEAPRSSFPDDIQTSFEFRDTSSFTEEHDAIFGDYSLLNFVNIEGQLTILP